MSWTTTDEVDDFLAEAGEFLNAEPARNTVILSVTETLRDMADSRDARPLFGWWREGPGPVSGAFMRTYAFPVLLTSMTGEAAADLAATLAATAGHALPGINAERQAAEAFATSWQQRTGDAAEEHLRMRLYRLGRLSQPEPGPGGASRVAGKRDRDLLVEWFGAFDSEVAAP